MTNPPTFTVAPTSVPGHSLLQWRDPESNALDYAQIPTEIAEHLAALAARNVALTESLQGMVWAAQMTREWSEDYDSPLGKALATLRTP